MITDWKLGDRIDDRWEIGEILPRSDHLICRIYDLDSGRSFTMRTLPVRLLQSEEAVEMFRHWAELWVRLDFHPHLLEIKHFTNIAHRPCLFFKPWQGTSLAQLIADGPLEVDRSLSLAIQLADAMHYLHHRLGPVAIGVGGEDVLVQEKDVVKIADFAYGKVSPGEPPEIAELTSGAGREIAESGRDGARRDILAFGRLIREMLTGERPHFDLPRELVAFCRRCAVSPPGESFPDFLALREEAERLFAATTGHAFLDTAGSSDPVTHILKKVGAPTIIWKTKPFRKANALLNLGHCEEAIELFDKYLETRPDAGAGWLQRGLALSRLGRPHEAIASYDRALRIDPEDADAWNNKALELEVLERYEEAEECYERALEIASEHHLAWRNRGEFLLARRRLEEALSCFSRSLGAKPRDAETLTASGRALYGLGRYLEAIQSFEEAIEIDPRQYFAHACLGACFNELGDFERAIGCFDRSLALKPESAVVWNDRGVALYSLDRVGEAFQAHERALEADSTLASGWLNKGRCLAYWGKYEEALACYGRALELEPGDAMAWNNQGHSLMGRGNYRRALRSFDRALEIRPDLDLAWYNRGAAKVRLGLHQEAIGSFRRVLEINPGHPDAARAIRAVEEEVKRQGR